MDRIIFGDNQFFGVDHLSDDRARQKEQRFKDTGEIIRVLDMAYDAGIRTFMCTTYARIGEICEHIRQNQQKYAGFKIYPCMPYAHKYANAVTEMGIAGALSHFTGQEGLVNTIARGSKAVVKRDAIELMQILVDTEMSMFHGVETGVIFLQNVITDLLLGLGMHEFFGEFAKYVGEKYNSEAGFITMNLPLLTETLLAQGMEKPIVCASINKIGFRMSGTVAENEAILASGNVRGVAMQVLAAGALGPDEAMEYVSKLPGVESVLFGASSRGHIEHSAELIRHYSNDVATLSDVG